MCCACKSKHFKGGEYLCVINHYDYFCLKIDKYVKFKKHLNGVSCEVISFCFKLESEVCTVIRKYWVVIERGE